MFVQVIFCAILDPKPQLRESAVNALRMALWVTAQRETSTAVRQQGQQGWYLHCYTEAMQGLTDNPPALKVLDKRQCHPIHVYY